MTFSLNLPTAADMRGAVTTALGEILFVVGPNGAGKSRFMQRCFMDNANNALRISAHRHNSFSLSSVSITPADRITAGQNFVREDANTTTAWYESNPELRIRVALFDLVDAENSRARKIAGAVDVSNIELATTLAAAKAPLASINELLRLSNLPIVISLREDGMLVASKSGSPPYGVHLLSDGEKNALIIISNILTAKAATLILIDEPERHLHHSISAPMLSLLLSKRSDCAFVVSTHDIMLPVGFSNSVTILLRGCQINGPIVTNWDADILPAGSAIDELTKEDILGGRRKMLFIEGTPNSLDLPLYSLAFPQVSIVPKASCRDVEHAVTIIREEHDLHWVQPFGIVDRDTRGQEEIDLLKARGIYAVPFYSVEAIYYHPEIQRRLAERQVALLGGNATDLLSSASAGALDQVGRQADHLSRRIAERAVRDQVFQHLPTRTSMREATPIAININVERMIIHERGRLRAWVEGGDLPALLERYPLRESGALGAIATALQFSSRDNYESAVIKLLMDDGDSLAFVRSLFNSLYTDLAL